MKNILIITFVLLSSHLFCQLDFQQLTNYETFTVSQSTTVPGHNANLAIDGITTPDNYTSTYYGKDYYEKDYDDESPPKDSCDNNTPWWEIDLGDCYLVKGVQTYTPDRPSGYYLFLSESPFYCDDIDVILADEGVSYFHVSNPLPDGDSLMLPQLPPTRYIRIQGDNFDVPISLSEVKVFADISVVGCDGWTDLEKYGEDCDDGIDNDGDGLTDCEDWPCGVDKYIIHKVDPTCPICNDGEICIVTNDHTEQVSIDGGHTYYNVTGTEKCFSNLGEGEYKVVVKTRFGCTSEGDLIVLSAPLGNPTSSCLNGDFEDGNFNNWEGGLGKNLSGNIIFDNTTLDLYSANPRHSIINTTGFQDQYVPQINNYVSGIGMYIAKLGNDSRGAEAERLKYCFTVDDNNKNFYFNFAMVMEDPGDHESFFSWKIYKKDDETDVIDKEEILSSSEYLDKANGFRFMGWTCRNLDLGAYMGEELCLEFINADCERTGHFAYAYIDGICGDGLSPIPILTSVESICYQQNEEQNAPGVEATGGGYNQYKWDITVLNENGDITHQFESEQEIGYSDEIDNLIDYIFENTGTTVECNSKIKVGFNAIGDCNSTRVEKEIFYTCNSYTIDYCDPLYYCGGANVNQLTIMGDIDCNGCTYEWESSSPYGGLNKYNVKFPIVDRAHHAEAFDNTYFVTVTSPEGCVYEDIVNIKPGPQVFIFPDEALISDCGGEGTVFSTVTVKIVNVDDVNEISFVDQVTGEVFIANYDASQSNGINKYFVAEIPRNIDRDLELDLSNYPEIEQYPNCYDTDYSECSLETSLFLPTSNLNKPWVVVKNNAFCPNIQDYFYHENFIIDVNDPCNTSAFDAVNSSISYYMLRIYSRWGDLIFEESIEIDPTKDTNGVDIRDVKWDGKFNGYYVSADVYTWTAEVHSCYSGDIDYDVTCQNEYEDYHETSTEQVVVLAGDVTVFYLQ